MDGGGGPVPLERRAEGLVEGRGLVAEGRPELAVVDDPAVGELVERVQVLAHRRLDQADRPERRTSGGQGARLVAGHRVALLDDLAGGAGLGDREVPGLTDGSGCRTERDESGRHVWGVGVAVQLVGVTHHLRGLARDRRTEDRLSECGAGGARTEVVRCATDGDLDLACGMRTDQLLGHRRTSRRLLRGGVGPHGLDEVLSARRAVGVEVVEYDEPGAGACRPRKDASLQGRELHVPALVVHRVEAEVDDVCAGADGRRERRVSGVTADDLGAGEVAPALPVHGDDVVSLLHELGDDRVSDLAGAEDDVAGHDGLLSVWWRRLRRTGRTEVRRVATMAPAEPKTVNCSSTWTPMDVVTAQPAAQMALRATGQASARDPRRGRSTTAWAAPTRTPHTAL